MAVDHTNCLGFLVPAASTLEFGWFRGHVNELLYLQVMRISYPQRTSWLDCSAHFLGDRPLFVNSRWNFISCIRVKNPRSYVTGVRAAYLAWF